MLINQPMSANAAGNGITPRIKNQKPSIMLIRPRFQSRIPPAVRSTYLGCNDVHETLECIASSQPQALPSP